MSAAKAEVKKKRDKDTKYLTRMLILVLGCIAYVLCSIPYR
jgi:hypothetical protein